MFLINKSLKMYDYKLMYIEIYIDILLGFWKNVKLKYNLIFLNRFFL